VEIARSKIPEQASVSAEGLLLIRQCCIVVNVVTQCVERFLLICANSIKVTISPTLLSATTSTKHIILGVSSCTMRVFSFVSAGYEGDASNISCGTVMARSNDDFRAMQGSRGDFTF
jgi:hypothetical protein